MKEMIAVQLKTSILFITLLFSNMAFAKKDLLNSVKLSKGSLTQLETYQRAKKKDPNKPFKVEFICFKKDKKKGLLDSNLDCQLDKVKFTE